ncbi:outer membrane protein OmpA-like peptidoglycan-associated protein [Saonia flava]|uniref:Outer membrane protein OmpA-like peptidoglycan-associated protein n=1 Tax=Saonia flava TaxID=523696 RepID=A0A846R762_9FLAO|nr:OmpA family protein [Saonia flava]NJB72609.1 outer membrane protein OmpA-like peptidoglycan-associated protein [Saonia flava]
MLSTIRKGFFLLVLNLFQYVPAMAQNLVKNPSFEEYIICPKTMGNFEDDVKDWSAPTAGTTDYFNTCSTIMGAPKNFNGSQVADFGQGYVGFYMHAPDDYREYIQAQLKTTLIKGEKYTVSFYVSWADESDMAIRDFGVLFSEKQVYLPTKKPLSGRQRYKIRDNAYHMIDIENVKFYDNKDTWVLVSIEIVAKGKENFLILGNFKSNAATRRFKTGKKVKKGAYYYVDLVSVVPENPNKVTATIELDKTNIFEKVLFDFDEYSLKETAKISLKRLFKEIGGDEALYITIHGHTDNQGSNKHNKRLSNNRAQAVGNYLIELGLSKERVNWKGHGGEQPVTENDTEEGRQQNRRAEFVIMKK